MPTVNVLLQLYKGGWREQRALVIEDNLRIEAALGTGAIDSPDEAERVAVGQLALYSTPIVARTVAVEPAAFADTPWLSHVPGNTITEDGGEQVVESLAFRRDQDGHLDFYAELNTHIDTPTERFELALKKMSNGTLGGTSRPAQPVNLAQPAQLYRPAGTGGGSGACGCSWLLAQGDTSDSGNLSIVAAAEGYKEIVFYGPPLAEEGGWVITGGGGAGVIVPPDPNGLYHVDILCSFIQSSGADPVLLSAQVLDPFTTWIAPTTYMPAGAAQVGVIASRIVALGQSPFGVSVIMNSASGAAATRSVGVYVEITAHQLCGCVVPGPGEG